MAKEINRKIIRMRMSELTTAVKESNMTEEAKQMLLQVLSDWKKQVDY